MNDTRPANPPSTLVRLIHEHFPVTGMHHAFAYGSGVFTQPGLYDAHHPQHHSPMIDLLFVVQDPVTWHTENISINPNHYARPMQFLGPRAINWASENIGSGIYFNAMVDVSDTTTTRRIKYGVASADTVHKDLVEWNTLYIAGRLHKPVQTLLNDQHISQAQHHNLSSAVRTALLLLQERGQHDTPFSIHRLLHTICTLSYIGDIRVGIAEDAKKVDRILRGSRDSLLDMYMPLLQLEIERGTISIESTIHGRPIQGTDAINHNATIQMHPSHREQLIASLPIALRRHITERQWTIHKALASIVRRSSARQAALGVISAGPAKAAMYLLQKVKKVVR